MSSSGPASKAARPSRAWALPLAIVILGVFGLLLWMALRDDGDGASSTQQGAADDAARPAEQAGGAIEGVEAVADGAAPGGVHPTNEPPAPPPEDALAPERLVPELLGHRPHDPEAFTQGLRIQDGVLYESTGLRGRSSLRRVDPETGETLALRPLDDAHFGEGLALVDDRLLQLTWQSGLAFAYDRETLEPLEEFRYEGEGWGLCYDGERLVMSDGSDELTFRDAESFEALGRIGVTLDGQRVANLNELECVDGAVWANVWQTNRILRIDPDSGVVTGVADASRLAQDARSASAGRPLDVLNGIAYDEDAGTFLLTGKLWPRVYEVRFQAAAEAP